MSALGQKQTLLHPIATSANGQQADILNSLLSAILFLVCDKEFPVLIAGKSSKEALCLNRFVQAGRGFSTIIPCIFPVIREFR
jgi:hypothetical protein